MFSRLSFRAKLLSLCLLLCSVSVAVGAIGYFGLREVRSNYHFVAKKVMPKALLADKMFLEYRRVRITLRTLGLPGLTKEDAERAISDATQAIEHFEETKKEYLALGFAPGQKEHWDKVDAAWDDFKGVGARVISLYKSGKPDDFKKMLDIFFNDCPQKAKIFAAAGENLLNFHRAFGETKVALAVAAAEKANTSSILAIIIGLAVGLATGFFFSQAISKTMQNIVAKLNENASQVASASSQIASSSEELSSASTEQASSLEETASSLEQISSMIAKSSDSAQSTASSAADSKDKAEKGRSAVDSMLNSIVEISESNEAIMNQVNASNQQMTEIVKVIQEIGNKTKVINEIVFQTKLLSFNASVEAARAGEHGKGFAVVAEEVGNLAQMSGNAAKEISEMLEGSISKVGNIVEETKSKVEMLIARGKEKVQAGQGIAHQCSDVLNDILQEVTKVSRLSQEISQASNEQAEGVAEINKAMRQLDSVTQQNSATSEEAASAAEELSAQADSLKGVVNELIRVMNGTAASAPPIPPAHVAAPSAASNVVRIKPPAVKSEAPLVAKVRAAGGMQVPSRDNAGFEEI